MRAGLGHCSRFLARSGFDDADAVKATIVIDAIDAGCACGDNLFEGHAGFDHRIAKA